MKNESEINEVQALIMRQLSSGEALRFSELNIESFPSDQFSYHLRQLARNGIIEKTEGGGLYQLSVMGRSRAILLDNRSNSFIEQGFVACRIILSEHKQGIKRYLVQARTRVPFRGYIGDPGGKILFGEDITEAAKRNMLLETGFQCDMEIKGVAHFRDKYNDMIVQDKFFFVIKATNPLGELLTHGPTGTNHWMTLKEIDDSPHVHQGLTELFKIAEGDSFDVTENTHINHEY